MPPPVPKSWKMRPYTPRLPKIRNHCWPVVMRCGKNPPKVFKFSHQIERYPVGLEDHRCDFLRLILSHTLDFPLRSFGTYHHGLMLPIKLFPGDKHFGFGAAREGWFPYSRTTSMSHTWRCTKLTKGALRIIAFSGHAM